MANPLGSDLAVNLPLQIVQNAFLGMQNSYIAGRVFPIIPVQQRSGRSWTFDTGSWLRSSAEERPPSTPSVGSGYRLAQADLYYARVYAIHKDVDYQTRAETEANGFYDIDAVSVRWATRQLLLKRELIWANTYFKAGVWTGNLTGVAATPAAGQFLQWNGASSTPIDDIANQALNQQELTGFRPNTLVISPRVRQALLRNAQVLDAAKSVANVTGEPLPNDALLARVLGVDRVFVASEMYNSAAEGLANAIGPIYGRHALLVYSAPDPSMELPSGGYTFTWNGYLNDGGFEGNRVTTFYMEEIKSDRIEAEMAFDMKIVAPDTGTFFANAIA